MKQILAIALLLMGTSLISGQTNGSAAGNKPSCRLTSAQAPVVRGVKLGMTLDQVLALFPGSKEDSEVRSDLSRPPSQFGVISFLIRPGKYSASRFEGIREIVFSLMDGHLSNFNVSYDGPEWRHVDEFVMRFTKRSNLPPPDAWTPYVGLDTQLKTLKCDGFEMRVFAGGAGGKLNYVQLRDTLSEQKLKNRRDKFVEESQKKQKQ